jgi:hypothetical protein
MAHIVTGPLVIAKKEDGADLYLYENAVVPEHVSADELKRLVALGLVEKVADGKTSSKAPTAESN